MVVSIPSLFKDKDILYDIFSPLSVFYGILMGTLTFVIPLLLTNYADSKEYASCDRVNKKIGVKGKNFSVINEFLFSMLFAFLILNENFSAEKIFGCMLFIISYFSGIFLSERKS